MILSGNFLITGTGVPMKFRRKFFKKNPVLFQMQIIFVEVHVVMSSFNKNNSTFYVLLRILLSYCIY